MKPVAFLLCVLFTLTNPLLAQPTHQRSSNPTTITPAERRQTIEATLKLLNDKYVQPEMANRMEQYVRGRLSTYQAITDGHALARQLTTDLRTVSHDQHLNISYFDTGVPDEHLWKKDLTSAERESQRIAMRKGLLHENFGILDVSVLRGNLGYLNVKYLAPPEFAGESYSAALTYLAQTDALIIDLRQCGGAMSEHAIPLLCSYFFDEPTHLNDIYWRDGNRTIQSWTYAQVPGRRYGNKPIYILTSRQTFSGAEELAYDLKNRNRAVLVGDTTGGGANPGGTLRINDHFAAFVPVGRAINPITHTNWEGVGVVPDTAVAPNRALYIAQCMAFRQLSNNPALDPDWRNALTGILGELERNPPRYVRQTFVLRGYDGAKDVRVAGSFNGWAGPINPFTRWGDAWVGEVEVEPGKLAYKFVVDGQWITDPANSRTEGAGQYTNSVLEVVAK